MKYSRPLSVFAVGCMRQVPSANQVSLGLANIKSGSFAMDLLVEELSGFDRDFGLVPKTVELKIHHFTLGPLHFQMSLLTTRALKTRRSKM